MSGILAEVIFMCLCLVATNHLFAVLIISFLICHEEKESSWAGAESCWLPVFVWGLSSQMTTPILPPDEKLMEDLVSC